ncbi:MAG: peptidylprolyl isomerase [Nevskia sp.]
MMQQIRDGLKGPVIYGLLVLIIGVPFAFSGIQGYLQNSTDPLVAKVGDVKITQAQLRNAYDQRYRQLQQLYGENFRADLINPTLLREQVLKDMVQESLLRQYARSSGYRTPDSSLRDYLTKVGAFQENGQFSAKRYRELLSGVGQTPDRFEAQQRDLLMVEQLRETVLGSAFVTAAEAEQNAKLAHQQREFSYLKFEPSKYLASVTVSDAGVAKRYEEKKASYQSPERIRLAYVELSPDRIPKADPPVVDVLKTLYESEKATRFSTPEVRMASHILVNFGADKAAAKKKADDLYAQIKGGADFAALAKTGSDDTGSKAKGGDLGPVKRGDGVLPPKFESTLFSMEKAGEVNAPIETDFGWHIIRLNELKPARTQAFDEPEVQKALIDLYQQAEVQKHFQEKSTKLEELAFDNAASLEPVAKALDLKVETTDWFTRKGGSGILSNAGVIAAAFSPEVLTSNENSKPIAVEGGRLIVVRKAEYEAPRQKTLAEVDALLRDELRNELAAAKAKADADTALAALKSGKTLDEVAKAQGLVVQSPGPSARDRNDLGKSLLSALFTLPHPEAGKPSLGEAALEKGELAVIALTAVRDGTESHKPAEDPKKLRTVLRDARAGSEFAAYRAALEKRVSVDIKPLPKEETLAP